jgi:hypothetical protein
MRIRPRDRTTAGQCQVVSTFRGGHSVRSVDGVIFLVEYYEPDSSASAAGRIAARAREAAGELVREGADLQFLRATVVPAEQTCFLLFEAPSAELVGKATQRAAIPNARVTEARESQ